MLDFITSHQQIFANIFGFSAIFVVMLMYQFKKHKTILLLMVLTSALWCCHFAVLGLMTPVAMNFVNVIRSFVFSFRNKKWAQSNLIPIAFLLVSMILVIFTWDGIWSILPCIGTIFATVANWQKDTKKLKLLTIPVCCSWLTYNAINHSWAGLCNETFALISIFVFLFRIRKSEKQSSAQSTKE
ncbi:MAG: YgjV family protein [Clostridia bacterium]|nr:YgjV family protein [Clostridia bacterium]